MKTATLTLALLTFSVTFGQEISCYGDPKIDWDTSPLTEVQRKKSLATNFSLESDNPKDFYIYNGFVVKYDESKKAPLWTTHNLPWTRVRDKDDSGNKIRDMKIRSNYCLEFKRDPNQGNIQKQPHHNDYIGSGFDKGHMTPAGDFRNDSTGTLESFYITNITLQSPDYNQIVMVKMENSFRKWAIENKANCQIITGALYQDLKGRGLGSQNKSIDYPSAFYKILYAEINGKTYLYCFLVPHEFAYPDYKLSNYQVSLDEIEKLAGEDFLDKLTDELEKKIEAEKMPLPAYF